MFLSFEVMIFFPRICVIIVSSLPFSFQHTTTLQSPLILVKLGLVIDIVIVSFLHFLCHSDSYGLIFASNKFSRLFLLSLLFLCGCTYKKERSLNYFSLLLRGGSISYKKNGFKQTVELRKN